ncbi:biotin carboxylase [Kitasatospora sp. MAP12-15]|uniref:ATP-grasp domain-containing protein n=1 Tax=unclassified Kitasatospora TaxID=2633591 RepID=UPI00247656C7|nr:ATP-grasp domain-containing protein [Kitasatospora sp. MAP12-44]MDH6113897.1 biotin carboxylase [Kitasatospora sp. MAP12-44]
MKHLLFVESTGLGIHALEYARKLGHRTTLLWSPSYDFFAAPEVRRQARESVDQAIRVEDIQDPVAVLAALHGAGIHTGEIDAVLTTLHMCVLPAAELAEAIGALGTSREAINSARDKGRCRTILREQQIPSLGFAVVTEAAQALAAAAAIGYPVVVKPVSGLGKTVTAIAHSPQEVSAHFAQADARCAELVPGLAAELDDRFIVEELAVGPLYSVEVATDGVSFTPLAAVRRKTGLDNPVLELGSTMPCGLDSEAERELGAYAVRVCRALGLDLGIFHVEVIGTADGFRLVEVNPRIAGGTVPEVIRAATGQNLFETLVTLFDGGPVPAEPYPVRTAASHTFLATAEDCTVRGDLPADWFEAFRPRLHSGDSSIEAGSRLRRMDGNFDTYGVVRVTAKDFARAELDCTQIRSEIEELLGVRMTPVAPSGGPS